MGKHTGIAWTDHTFNPWWGCTKVSPGCAHCYAERIAERLGMNIWGPGSRRSFFDDRHWLEPKQWNRAAETKGTCRRVFCGSMCDVFEDRPELRAWRNDLWQLVMDTPRLTWLFVTKRPENIAHMCSVLGAPNVWLGTSVEDQMRADLRIPFLLQQRAVMHFLSVEPMLGPVSLEAVNECIAGQSVSGGIDWIIIGGESGRHCRPMNLKWVRAVRDECRDIGIQFFMKQLGGWPNKRDAPDQWPEDLRMQEFPKRGAGEIQNERNESGPTA